VRKKFHSVISMVSLTFSLLTMLTVVISSNDATAAMPETFADSAYVTKVTRLWTEPTRYGEAIAVLKAGIKLDVTRYSTNGTWAKVVSPQGREGWIPVRFTSLSGRRDRPIIMGQPLDEIAAEQSDIEEQNDGDPAASRNPASLPVEAAQSSESTSEAPAINGVLKKGKYDIEAGLGYVNQLSRGAGNGVHLQFKFFKNASAKMSIYGAFDYVYASESATNFASNTQTSRSSSEIIPSLGLRMTQGSASINLGIGFLRDITSYETRILGSGEVITDDSGFLLSGSESMNFLFFALEPTYTLGLNPRSALNIGMNYHMYLDFSDGSGAFAGSPSSKAQHNLGLKLSYLRTF